VISTTAPVILAHFDELTDPRIERTKLHSLTDMVAIALCAAICGAEGWADVECFGRRKHDWFARFLELPHGSPSHDTAACSPGWTPTSSWPVSSAGCGT